MCRLHAGLLTIPSCDGADEPAVTGYTAASLLGTTVSQQFTRPKYNSVNSTQTKRRHMPNANTSLTCTNPFDAPLHSLSNHKPIKISRPLFHVGVSSRADCASLKTLRAESLASLGRPQSLSRSAIATTNGRTKCAEPGGGGGGGGGPQSQLRRPAHKHAVTRRYTVASLT